MDTHTSWITLLALFAVNTSEGQDRSETDEAKLYDRLFHDGARARYIRPVQNSADAVHVQISLALIGLEDLDAGRQVMASHVWLRQKWTDPFLKWNPSDFGGLQTFLAPVEKTWTPDLVPHNSLGDMYRIHHDSMAHVESSGEVTWITQSRLETFCHMDFTDFPYDQHNCSIQFGSWAYDAYKVNISHWGEPEFDLDYGSPNRQQTWEITDTGVEIKTQIYGGYPEPYQDITTHVVLRRRTTYVTHVFVAPAVMFVLLVPAVFILPADSSTKFILGSGIMVSQVLLLLMLEEFLKSAFSTIPRLGLYYLSILILVAFSLGVSAFVANLWNRSRRRSVGVPGMIRVVFLKGLGRLLCVHYDDFLSAESTLDQDTDTISTNLDSVSNSSMNPLDGAKMIREYNSQVVNRAEWRQLAAIADRVFCFVFLVVSALIATAILIKF